MVSPLVEVNSASLGAWTSTVGGVVVALGEVVNLRLADAAGAKYWSLAITSTDDVTVAPTLSVNTAAKTASFTMPSTPTDGIALIFTSQVGVMNLGLDSNGAVQASYTYTFKLHVLAPTGIPVLAKGETLEGSTTAGWTFPLNEVIRHPPGSGGPPTGAATGDLTGSYPSPTVLKIRGATIGTAAGALVVGAVLRVTGASTVDYGAVNLASAAAVTGLLPTANFAPGTNGQAFVTAAGAGAWVTPAGDWTGALTANTVGKLKGTTITTAGGALATGRVLVTTGVAAADWSLLSGTASISPGGSDKVFATNTANTSTAWLTPTGDWDSILTANKVRGLTGSSGVVDLHHDTGVNFTLRSTSAQVVYFQNTVSYVSIDAVGKIQIRVGAASIDGTVSLTAGPNGIRVANDSTAPQQRLEVAGNIVYDAATVSPKLFVQTPSPDVATTPLIVRGQAPSVIATGTNQNSGNVQIQTALPVGTGVAGNISLETVPGISALSVVDNGSGDQRVRLFQDVIHIKAGTASPGTFSPVTPGGSLYFKNSVGTEDLLFRQNGAWVSVLTGGAVTLAGDVTGSVGANTVGKIKGTTISTAGGALATGLVLQTTGVATADWVALTSSQIPLSDTFEDDTSLVDGRFGPLWAANTPAQAPTIHRNAGTLSIAHASVPKNADLINIGANAPTNGLFERIAGTPTSGVANYEINIPMAKPVGDGTTTIYVEIKVYGGALVASGTFTLTTTWTTYTIASFALSATTDYIVRWFCNGSGSSSQARAFVGPLQWKPLTPSAPFITDPYYRVPITPEMFHDGVNQKPPIFESRSHTRNAHTRFLMRTTAPYLFTQSYDKGGSGANNAIGVKVNGVPQTPLVPASGGSQTDYSKITLSSTGMQVVELTTSYSADASGIGNAAGWYMNLLDAVLVPKGYFFEVLYPSTPRNRVVFYGDSIPAGIGPTNPALNGFPQQIRRGYAGSVVFETNGSGSWFKDMKSPGAFPATDVQVANLVDRLAAHFGAEGTGILYTMMSVNDWAGAGSGTCSAANLQILVGQFLDSFHLRCPYVQIVVQSATADSLQANTNTFGDNLAAYRTALSNAATAAHRTGFCTYVDGTSILSTGTDLADTVHPNDLGVVKLAASVLSTIATVRNDTTTPKPNSWDVVTPGFVIANQNNAGRVYMGAWAGGGASFGAVYVAADRTVANSYALLGDGTNTYLNAPSSGGHIYFGLANSSGSYDLTYDSNGLAVGKAAVTGVSRLDVKTKAIGEVGIVSRWFSSGQTGDLFQGRKQDETVVASISKDGNVLANAAGATAFLGVWSGGSTFGALYLGASSGTTTAYIAISSGTDTFWNAPSGSGKHYWSFANSGGNPVMNFSTAGLRIGDATVATDKLEVKGNIAFDVATICKLYQPTATSGNGRLMSVTAQNGFQTGDTNGGELDLNSGAGHGTGVAGNIALSNGASLAMQLSPTAITVLREITSNAAALILDAASAHPITFEIGGSTFAQLVPGGDFDLLGGVLHITDATTVPTSNPASGIRSIYGAKGLAVRNSNGVVALIAPN